MALDTAGIYLDNFPTHTVELIDRIDDPGASWAPLESPGQVQRLFCDELHRRCNGVDTARLSMEIGESVQQIGDTTFASYSPADLVSKFVKIEIPQPDPIEDTVWVGYIIGTSTDRSAVKEETDPDDNKLVGRKQFFECVGLAYFLGRTQISTGAIRDGLGDERYVGRALTFNGDRSLSYDNDTSKRGNRFTLPQFNEDGDPEDDENAEDFVFTNNTQPGFLWSAKDIVRHVLRYHQPTNKDGDPSPCKFRLQFRADDQGEDIPDDQGVLTGWHPTIPTERQTPLDILNLAIDPRRGVCWWQELRRNGFGVQVTQPGFIEARIRVASRASADITLPTLDDEDENHVLPANVDQQTLNLDQHVDVEDFRIEKSDTRRYHQVRCRGARMTTTCTLSTEDETLEANWSSDLETEYKTGGSGIDAATKDIYRRNEKFRAVYAEFRIPEDWDGDVNNGLGTGTDSPALPVVKPDGSTESSWQPAVSYLRVLNTTRLLVGYNYAVNADEPTAIHEIPSTTTPDMMRPFAFFVYTPSGGGDTVARYSHQLPGLLGPVGDLTEAYHYYSLENTPGFGIRGTAGRQHKMAGDSWTGTGTDVTNVAVELDFESGDTFDVILAATVTIEADVYAEGVWPENLDHVPEGVAVQVLDIYLGDKYRLDYLANETTLFLDDSTGSSAPVLAAGGLIRNDQDELQAIARMRYEWYSIDRQPVSITFKHCRDVFRLGMLITTIGEGSTLVNVNSVVTSIQFDLLRGRMTVGTDEADLDIA